MTKKNISYNLYTVRKDYTVSAYLTEPPKEEVKPKVQLNFLAKSDNITWDLTVQGLIDRLKELPPNATIIMPMYCTEFAIGDVVAYVK